MVTETFVFFGDGINCARTSSTQLHSSLYLGIINSYYTWAPRAAWGEKVLMGFVLSFIQNFPYLFKGSTSRAPDIGNVTSPSQLPSTMNTTQLPSTKQPPSKGGSSITEGVIPIVIIILIILAVIIGICICIYMCVKRKSSPQGGKEQTGVSLWFLVGLVCWTHGTGVPLDIGDVNSGLHASIAKALPTGPSFQSQHWHFDSPAASSIYYVLLRH